MQHPDHFNAIPDSETTQTRSSDFLTQCHRNALDRLRGSFDRRSPLALLLGEGKSTARFVIRKFLSRLDNDVAVVRFVGPCASATDFLKQIVAAIGFQPKDMSLADLDSIFAMFLSFQKAHSKRTVICVEEAQECDWWVLDKIRSMVEMERTGNFGLMLVLAGQKNFSELLSRRPLDSIAAYAGKRISLAPFTLPETREYLRHRVEALGKAGIDEVLDFHAIGLIHKLCSGVPDTISDLFGECLRQAEIEGIELVTQELVTRAYEVQRDLAGEPFGDDEAAETITSDSLFPPPGRLVVQLTGQDLREIRLRRRNILIGRSKLCDVRIDSRIVSRHHALIRYTSKGAMLIDLGSTNGTKVDGYSVKEHCLVGGETIAVGDCLIEYLLEDALDRRIEDAKLSMQVELGS
ncbi:MAG: FHA domain-containing protein [Woeseiaceae bacterium]